MNWDDIRAQLGGGFVYGPGHWFCVPHKTVRRSSGRHFAVKDRPGDGRRLVLATAHGPNCTVFARSASVEAPYAHAEHEHDGRRKVCKLDEDGWIPFEVPVNVPYGRLNAETYSCEEPEGSQLYDELERRARL